MKRKGRAVFGLGLVAAIGVIGARHCLRSMTQGRRDATSCTPSVTNAAATCCAPSVSHSAVAA